MKEHQSLVDTVAEALANQISMRKGCPPIKNCLALMPPHMAEIFRDDARAAIASTGVEHLQSVLMQQTLLVDRLCTAVDQAAEDVGHENIDDLLRLIGPQNEQCIEASRRSRRSQFSRSGRSAPMTDDGAMFLSEWANDIDRNAGGHSVDAARLRKIASRITEYRDALTYARNLIGPDEVIDAALAGEKA